MRLVPPGNSSKEIVKVKVERCVGTRSFEVVTEDGARYRRNRRHMRRTKEAYRSPKPGLVAETPRQNVYACARLSISGLFFSHTFQSDQVSLPRALGFII